MPITVEVAGPDDWPRVREVRLRALADAPDAFFRTHAEEVGESESWWRDRVASDDATTFLAVGASGEVIGTAVLGSAVGAPDALGLYSVWVEPDARGTGAADRLVDAVIAAAERSGKQRLLLDVGDHNTAAQRFYARHGFRPTGRTNRFEPPRDHITEHELARPLGGGGLS